MEFRKLRADEIECRIGSVKKDGSGMSLLLYKDARCDMNILDETVGSFNWDREHKELKGVIYCGVTIRAEDGNYATKWDAGTESNTEAQKGEASDSFKRACFNWGIGRELYTAPFIWVKGYDKYEKFKVDHIEYEGNKISNLVIIDSKGGIAYKMHGVKRPMEKVAEVEKISPNQVEELTALIDATNSNLSQFCKYFKILTIEDMKKTDYDSAVDMLNKKLNKMVAPKFDNAELPEAMK